MLKRTLSALLAVLVLVSGLTFANMDSASASSVNSAQLQYIAQAPKNDLYTDLYLAQSGTYANTAVQAYVGQGGEVQYRMYGSLAGVDGFYPLNVLYDNNTLAISASSRTPAMDSVNNLAIAKPDTQKAIVPQGYTELNQQGVYSIENLFGEKEIVIRATYDGTNYVLVPAMLYEDFVKKYPTLQAPDYIAKTNGSYVPVPGALAYNIADQQARSKANNGNKTYAKPAQYKDGYSVYVDVLSSDSKLIQGARTVANKLDVAAIRSGNTSAAKPSVTAKPRATTNPRVRKPRATSSPRVRKPRENRRQSNGNNGSYSRTVKLYQEKLMALGYFSSVVDGIYGPITRKAIKAYQKANGLKQSGVLDKNTRRSIDGRMPQAPNMPSQSKAAIKSVANVTTSVQIDRQRYLQGQTVLAYTANGRNPSKVNVDLIVDIINLDNNRTVASVRKTAMDVRCAAGINVPGRYRARVFASRGKGLVLKDYKDFVVYANNDGQLAPNDATEQEKKNDTWLSVKFEAKDIRLGEVVNYKVSLRNYQDNHRYNIKVEPKGILPQGADNVQTAGYLYEGSFIPTAAGELPVKVTIVTPSGEKYRNYKVKVAPVATDDEKLDKKLDAVIDVPGGKLVQNTNAVLDLRLVNPVFDNDYKYSITCDKAGVIDPAINDVEYGKENKFSVKLTEAGDHKFTITVINKYNHTTTKEQVIKVEPSTKAYEDLDVVRTDTTELKYGVASRVEFKLKGAPQNTNYVLWAKYNSAEGEKDASGKETLIIPKFVPNAEQTDVNFSLYVGNKVVWTKTVMLSAAPSEDIEVHASVDGDKIKISTPTAPKKFKLSIYTEDGSVTLVKDKDVDFTNEYVYKPEYLAEGTHNLVVDLKSATQKGVARVAYTVAPQASTQDFTVKLKSTKDTYSVGQNATIIVSLADFDATNIENVQIEINCAEQDYTRQYEVKASALVGNKTISYDVPMHKASDTPFNIVVKAIASNGKSAENSVGVTRVYEMNLLSVSPALMNLAVMEANTTDENATVEQEVAPSEENATVQEEIAPEANTPEANTPEANAPVEEKASEESAPVVENTPEESAPVVENTPEEDATVEEDSEEVSEEVSEKEENAGALNIVENAVVEENQAKAKSANSQKAEVKKDYTKDKYNIKAQLMRAKKYRGKAHRSKLYVGEKATLNINLVNTLLDESEYRVDVFVNGKLVASNAGLGASVNLNTSKAGDLKVSIVAYNHLIKDHENFKTLELAYKVLDNTVQPVPAKTEEKATPSTAEPNKTEEKETPSTSEPNKTEEKETPSTSEPSKTEEKAPEKTPETPAENSEGSNSSEPAEANVTKEN